MEKVLRNLIIGLLVLIVVAAVVAGVFLGNIVKKGIEIAGPQITKVSVRLDAVNLSFLTGSATVKGLVIGNPEGCKTPQAIRVGTIAVGVNPLSVFSDKIVLRSIRVEAPEITFEGGLGGNNLSRILDNVNATSKAAGPVSASAASANSPPKPARKFEVDNLLITGAKVHGSLTGLGGREISLTLPDIHLTDLGQGPDGITATELTRSIFSALNSATLKAVANFGGKSEKQLEQAGHGVLKNGLKSIDNLFK